MKNIGIVTTWFERGAAYVSKQYKALLERGNNVFVYARGENYAKGDPIWDGPEVWWGKVPNLPVPAAIDKRDFRNWLTENKIDLVLFNEQQWWPPVLWCAEWGIQTAAYIDYYTEDSIPLFEAYDFLLCNTRRHYSAFEWHPQAYYLPWGTDVQLFSPESSEPVQDGRVCFFQSCGFSPARKGTDFVLKAFEALPGNSKLILHSQTDLKKAFPELDYTIDELLQCGRLEIIEKTVSAPGLYHLGDVYVAPSRLEGIGLPVAEALACGLPVITVDNAPMNEFIDGTSGKAVELERLYARKDGYYWPQCTPKIAALTQAMQFYVEHADQLQTFKKKARDHAVKKLNWEDRLGRLHQIFSQSQVRKKPEWIERKITIFERRRSGLRLKLAQRYPLCYLALQRVGI